MKKTTAELIIEIAKEIDKEELQYHGQDDFGLCWHCAADWPCKYAQLHTLLGKVEK